MSGNEVKAAGRRVWLSISIVVVTLLISLTFPFLEISDGEMAFAEALNRVGTALLGSGITVGLISSKVDRIISPDGFASNESNKARDIYGNRVWRLQDIAVGFSFIGTLATGFSGEIASLVFRAI